jgi:hypothetical protein
MSISGGQRWVFCAGRGFSAMLRRLEVCHQRELGGVKEKGQDEH